MNNFEEQLAEILEVETLQGTDELTSFDSWDSLTILSIIAFCDESFGVALTGDEIEETVTVEGLKSYLLRKMKRPAS